MAKQQTTSWLIVLLGAPLGATNPPGVRPRSTDGSLCSGKVAGRMLVLLAILLLSLISRSAVAGDVPFTYRTQWGAVSGVGQLENGQLTGAATSSAGTVNFQGFIRDGKVSIEMWGALQLVINGGAGFGNSLNNIVGSGEAPLGGQDIDIRVDLSLGEPGTLSLKMPDVIAAVSSPAAEGAAPPGQQPQPNAASATSAAAAEPQQPVRKVKDTGSGFVIASNGTIVTANHVIDGCGAVSVGGPDQKIRPASIVVADRANDLAVLDVQASYGTVARFRLEPPIRQGESIIAVGYPLAGVLAYGTNLTTGIVSALAGIENDSRMLQITSPVQPGNSGGPLFDQAGNVVGVVEAELDAVAVAKATGDFPQNVNFAVKAPIVRGLLDANGIAYATSTASQPLATTEIADWSRRVTVIIICWE